MSADEETKFCSNCKRQIAVGNFVMHEVHCRRNIVLCEHCDEPVPRSELQEHFDEYHAKVKCEKCGLSVEKMAKENHTENECPKRPEHCAYCELDFPHCEIDTHKDYCGSRTEQCPLCEQFIMQKDLTKHEDSGCTYPEPKAVPNNNGRSRNEDADNRMSRDPPYLHNNFALGEIDRLIGPRRGGASNSRGIGPRNVSQRTVGVKKNNQNPPRREAPEVSSSTVPDTSTDAALAAHLNSNPDLDTDELLAAHLAQAQDSSPDFDIPASHTNHADFDADGLTLPCEFCGEPFPSEDLIQHQTRCRPEVNYYEAVDSSGSSVLNNARLDDPHADSAEPNIVDNLSHLSMQDGPVIDAEGTMLPCEFCDELYPMENLVVHQAVCDSNHTQTPRVQSPVVKFGARKTVNSTAGSTVTRAALKRQPDPTPSVSASPYRTSNIRNTGVNRNHFTGRPTPNEPGIDKWMNSEHVRPSKNTNVTRVTRTKRTVPDNKYGVNMDRTEPDELTLGGGVVAGSNVRKGHSDSNRSTLNQAGLRNTRVLVSSTRVRNPGVPRAAGASEYQASRGTRKTRSVPQASIGADLDDTASGASGLRLDGGPIRNGAAPKKANDKGSSSRNFPDQ